MARHRTTRGFLNRLLNPIASAIQSFFISRSIKTRRVSLSHRNIYIIPSRACLGALLIVTILLIVGINYQNNLMYLFTFWLLTLVIWNFVLGFYNLYQLTLTAVDTNNNFAGEPVQFRVALSTGKKSSHHFFLQLNEFFKAKKGSEVFDFDLDKNDRDLWLINSASQKRGPLKLPRIRIYSSYPFGFAHAFSYVNLDLYTWVYPKPKAFRQAIEKGEQDGEQPHSSHKHSQGTDFDSLKPYEPGDKIQRIHWQEYAKTGNLVTKQFSGDGGNSLWIRWQDFPYMPTEDRLMHLSFLIQQACEHNQSYGLDMPKGRIEPHSGETHKHQCLLLLAKYGFEPIDNLQVNRRAV